MTWDDVSEQDNCQNKGRLEVICGSMFSGKTEELIRRLKRAEFAKQKVVVFKPILDTRYKFHQVSTHYGLAIAAVLVQHAADILQASEGARVVGIDEAQFFDADLIKVCDALVARKIRVILAGLDMDYLGRPFGSIPILMAKADFVSKVHAICVQCGDTALHSHRVEGGKKLIEIGETDKYIPLCRVCFREVVAK